MAEPILDTVLRPSPPMRRSLLGGFLLAVIVINLLIAGFFVWHGAWPIAPFLGLDVLALALAFQASLRAAERFEHVVVTPKILHIARGRPGKPVRTQDLNPYWIRVELDDEGRGPMLLWSHGKATRLAEFLGPAQRLDFAALLRNALWQARTAR